MEGAKSWLNFIKNISSHSFSGLLFFSLNLHKFHKEIILT